MFDGVGRLVAAARRPEQLLFAIPLGDNGASVREHNVGGLEIVEREPEPADSSTLRTVCMFRSQPRRLSSRHRMMLVFYLAKKVDGELNGAQKRDAPNL